MGIENKYHIAKSLKGKYIKQLSDNYRIHFFRNLNRANAYFLKKFSDASACEFLLQSLHLYPYEESGYMDLKIEWAFAIECDLNILDKYLDFIKYNIGNKVEDENPQVTHWIADSGWYEFSNINDTEKWIADFIAHENRRQEEFLKATNVGTQTSLF